jgi:hypothetical protein
VLDRPGSPHSKHKTPFNPQFQCSRPPALSRSTARQAHFGTRSPQSSSARFTPQQAENSFQSPISMLSTACSVQKYCPASPFWNPLPPILERQVHPTASRKRPPTIKCQHDSTRLSADGTLPAPFWEFALSTAGSPYRLRPHRQSALPGCPNGSRKPLVDPTPNPQKMNPTPGKNPDQVHPTASSKSLPACESQQNSMLRPPESTALDRFGEKHSPTPGPSTFSASSSRPGNKQVENLRPLGPENCRRSPYSWNEGSQCRVSFGFQGPSLRPSCNDGSSTPSPPPPFTICCSTPTLTTFLQESFH